MGLFNKKSAKQKELEAENLELKSQLDKIKAENLELQAEKQKLEKGFAEKQSALVAEIYRLNKKNFKSGKFDSRLKNEKSGESAENSEGACEVAAARFETEKQESAFQSSLETELKNRYVLEINRLKTFIARWEKALLSGDAASEKLRKTALASALKQIFNFNEQELTLCELSDKVAEATELIAGGKREESGGIDLDEVLNPSEDLDLESLCKELGVME